MNDSKNEINILVYQFIEKGDRKLQLIQNHCFDTTHQNTIDMQYKKLDV